MEKRFEVPRKRSDNISMMDKEDKYLMMEYRDDLSDEGALRLDEELKYLKTQVVNILEKYPA